MVKKIRKRPYKRVSKGKVRNAQPKTYYGIDFKSKLELYTYKKLKEANIKFKYEKHIFPLLEKFSYRGQSMELFKRKGIKTFDWQNPNIRGITYTPDFVNMQNKWVIECKGFATDTFKIKWKIFKKYMTDKYPNFTLYVPRNQKQVDTVVKHIKENDRNN